MLATFQTDLIIDDTHFERVVREGILSAETSLAVATANFKAMLVPTPGGRRTRSIVHVFCDLADRGIEVRLLHSGVPSSAALQDLRGQIPDSLVIRRCPRLHTKTVIVDCRQMYLGSANLTGAGLGAKSRANRNFEAGIWTSDPALIDGILEHFNALWEGRFCEDCGRRAACPMPLEEPDLT
jgi:phosphatidylserine/phosphatidylglycerophosphate/cardiolipin synthase-like enzyme